MNRHRSTPLAALLLLTAACGAYRPDRAQGPWLYPTFLNGSFTGYQMILDRNGNVTGSARISRSCALDNTTAGNCRDSAVYESPRAELAQQLQWEVRYLNGHELELTFVDGQGRLQGRARGPLFLLEGDRKVPLSERTAHAEVRYHLLPGDPNPLLIEENYYMLGIHLGTVRTLWLRNPN